MVIPCHRCYDNQRPGEAPDAPSQGESPAGFVSPLSEPRSHHHLRSRARSCCRRTQSKPLISLAMLMNVNSKPVAATNSLSERAHGKQLSVRESRISAWDYKQGVNRAPFPVTALSLSLSLPKRLTPAVNIHDFVTNLSCHHVHIILYQHRAKHQRVSSVKKQQNTTAKVI